MGTTSSQLHRESQIYLDMVKHEKLKSGYLKDDILYSQLLMILSSVVLFSIPPHNDFHSSRVLLMEWLPHRGMAC